MKMSAHRSAPSRTILCTIFARCTRESDQEKPGRMSYSTMWDRTKRIGIRSFPVPKGDGTAVCIVADFKRLDKSLKIPVWPTERSNQLLRHIDAGSRYFAAMGLTSGYYQIPIDRESQDLLVISTTMGRFKYLVLAQGVCSASLIT